MSEQHTPEPWKTDEKNGFPDDIESAEGDLIARCPSDCADDLDGAENARRIVAAVNACAGISQQYLEELNGETIADKHLALIKQRDELLAALKKMQKCKSIYNMFPSSGRKSYGSIVDDALASVKDNTK